MQAVLFKIGKELGCTINLDVDHWGTVAQKIKDALDVVRKQAEAKKGNIEAWAEWKRREAAYNELLSDLSAVEKAWRHPSAHHRQTYKIDQAEKVLEKVTDFAKHAATLLPP
jgi:thymidylate synthase